MSNSSSTSTPGMPAAGPGLRPSSPGSPRTRFEGESPSPSTTASSGSSSTSASTETTGPSGTFTSNGCEFELLFQAGDPHPVGLVCTTHDLTFDVGTGI